MTFPNLRQNSVNAFEISYFYAQCLFLTSFLFNHPYHTLQFSHHASSTSVGSTSASNTSARSTIGGSTGAGGTSARC